MKTGDRHLRAAALAFLLVLILVGAFWLLFKSEQSDPPDQVASFANRPPRSPTLLPHARSDLPPREAPAIAAVPSPSLPGQQVSPPVFDLADITPPPAVEPHPEVFPTTPWFTEEDLLHPERYFEAAKRIPELNRPEERRDALEFFLRYREKLLRDLDAANPESQKEIRRAVARYDDAITRLRRLMGASSEPNAP